MFYLLKMYLLNCIYDVVRLITGSIPIFHVTRRKFFTAFPEPEAPQLTDDSPNQVLSHPECQFSKIFFAFFYQLIDIIILPTIARYYRVTKLILT